MSRIAVRMQREVVRHSVASVAAVLVTFAVQIAVTTTSDDRELVALVSSSVLALVFGVYGPVFLGLTVLAFRGEAGERLRVLLRRSDERSRLVRLLFLAGPKSWAALVVMAGVAAVVTIAAGGASGPLVIGICVLGVVGTWVLMVAVFGVEYMRVWANDDAFAFPGVEQRTFGDFAYLAVQMSTTFSASDVQLVRRSARNLAIVHSVVAFAYSTVIIAVFASLLIAG